MEKWQQQIRSLSSSTAATIAMIFFTFLLTSLMFFTGHDRTTRVFPTSFNNSNLLFRQFNSSSSVVAADDHQQLQSVVAGAVLAVNVSAHQISSSIVRQGGEDDEAERRKRKEERVVEEGLARSRAAIRTAMASSSRRNRSLTFNASTAFIYRNAPAFYQSYLEMEKRFKIYIYKEGEVPIVHDGPCKNVYTIEGRFIHEIEHGAGGKFTTEDPNQAHVYYMPFSITWMVKFLYVPLTFNVTPMVQFVSDYVNVISTKHPFWNRTQGADHFMLSCHDWGPLSSEGNPNLYNKSIRVLCNANSSEGFNPRKDVTLPEIYFYDGNMSPTLQSSPKPAPNQRQYLAFFAGGLHGPIRPILLKHWKDRDPDLQVHEYLPKNLDYYGFMLQSKFCLCPSGYEVASPRIADAIYAECVPVILSKNYVLPFSDVLRWEAFSIQVDISDIPRLKEILKAVSDEKYEKLVQGVKAVRQHFVLNRPAKRFDVFHMILHSVWLRRLNLKLR